LAMIINKQLFDVSLILIDGHFGLKLGLTSSTRVGFNFVIIKIVK